MKWVPIPIHLFATFLIEFTPIRTQVTETIADGVYHNAQTLLPKVEGSNPGIEKTKLDSKAAF